MSQAGEFSGWVLGQALHVERLLGAWLPGSDVLPARLHDAMRYAVLGGGKRVRAALVYAAGRACTGSGSAPALVEPALDRAAAAVELVHAYSLVHDDLPCMDDDTLRRGKPTLHVQYDEATALLAGDALQPLAFDWLAQMPVPAEQVVRAIRILARAAGSEGMAGGQAIDLESVGKVLTQQELQRMHTLKTGALLAASVELGGLAACATDAEREALNVYGQAMGLAFQVVDDVLDVTGDTAQLGKTAGKDAAANKPTYVALLGLDAARALASRLHRQALDAISPLGDAGRLLAGVADFIVLRNN